jgi:hypothetical protein
LRKQVNVNQTRKAKPKGIIALIGENVNQTPSRIGASVITAA